MSNVTEDDREAAAQLADEIQEWDIAKNIRAGTRDRFVWVQAFATHREAAAKAERDRIVAWLREMGSIRGGVADAIEAMEHLEEKQP